VQVSLFQPSYDSLYYVYNLHVTQKTAENLINELRWAQRGQQWGGGVGVGGGVGPRTRGWD
jgi:hypothetical protein